MNFAPPLHGLRGFAVLVVLLSHWGNAGHALLPVPHDAIGKAGVWIFFALSAYLLTNKAGEPGYLIGRFFRIFPLYVPIVLLHWMLGDIASPWPHLVLLDAYGELWAVPVEFTYYLAMPLLAMCSRPVATGLLVAGLFLSLATDASEVFGNGLSILPRLAPFVLGSLAALWQPQVSQRAGWLALVGLLAGIVTYRAWYLGLPVPPHALSWWLAACTVALILAVRSEGLLTRTFSARPLVWMGEVSFSLYLLHMFALRLPVPSWASFAVALVLAALTYRFVERPGIRLGKQISQLLRPQVMFHSQYQ